MLQNLPPAGSGMGWARVPGTRGCGDLWRIYPTYQAESTENHRVWHLGLPPFTGWWNCSTQEHPDCWRWFDAETKRLSHAVHAKAPPTAAAWLAYISSADIRYRTFMLEYAVAQGWPGAPDIHIAWNDYWPRNGVLRIWPGGEGQW